MVKPATALEPSRNGSASRRRQVQELVDAVQRLSLARSLPEVQAIVRTSARRLTGADGATFVLRQAEHCFYADEDAIASLWKGKRFPLETCISGWAMLNKQPAVIEDIYADPRIPHDAYRPTFVKSLAMVPMRTVDPIGAIGNYWARQHVPSDEEVELLQALADSTAVAMENVRVHQELEQQVRDRTAELEAVNERLVELDELRTRFVHATPHELRQPRAAVHGFASLLTSRLDEPEAEHAALIFQKATELSGLVDDLLKVAELEDKELPLQRDSVQLSDLVSASLRSFEPVAADAGLTLGTDFADEVELEADPLRLARLLDNLISNAIKYTPPDGHVTVRVRREGDAAVIEVLDDGIGIDDADKARVFEPFFRTTNGRKTAGGTGLGLKICREIAHAHGGELSVADTPGGGTTMQLRLPLA